jgi:hypothetical protein
LCVAVGFGDLAIFAAIRRALSRVSNVCFTPESRHWERFGGHCGQMQRQWIFESALFANTIIFSATILVMASLRSLKPRRLLRRI